MAATEYAIGILGEPAQRAVLQRLAEEAGCRVTASLGLEATTLRALLEGEAVATARAWIVDGSTLKDEEWLAAFLDTCPHPLLISDEAPPAVGPERRRWERRVRAKLDDLLAALGSGAPASGGAPDEIWILAASTGGPRAVGEFLGALAPGLPVALVYAQHIDRDFEGTLVNALARHRHYGVDLGAGAQRLCAGRVLVVPPDRQLRFHPFDRVVQTRDAWQGPYQPVIDQVVADLARLNGGRCHVIVFSGLCDDGALGCRVLRDKGGEVWVQSPESCVSPSMPLATLATGTVTRQGTPRELAAALNERYGDNVPQPDLPLSAAC